MRKIWVLAVALALAGCNKPAENKGEGAAANPQTDDQKTLYALGFGFGRNISGFNLTPEELDYVKAGMTAGETGGKPAVEIEKFGPKIAELHRTRQTAKEAARAPAEKEKGKAFLEQAAKEPGAQKTESGMVYQEVQAGTGAQPKATDVVTVNYKGTLIDGTEFDSSYSRHQPATFPLNAVIPCWTEGVQKMKVGGKAKLVCPSDLAYKDAGAPPKIPGGATLVFEVELLDIPKAEGMAPPAPTTPVPTHSPSTPPPGKSAVPPSQQGKKPEPAPTK
jgi:FKBP-type peptidyl-prolyl cis-trans isomerase FkpA